MGLCYLITRVALAGVEPVRDVHPEAADAKCRDHRVKEVELARDGPLGERGGQHLAATAPQGQRFLGSRGRQRVQFGIGNQRQQRIVAVDERMLADQRCEPFGSALPGGRERRRQPAVQFLVSDQRLAAACGSAAVLGAVALTGAGPAQAAAGLPRLDITGVYVTGVSSGGFMATQLQVAYSATFDGAGIIAAGPYDCGEGNVIDFATCNVGGSLATLEQQAITWSDEGLIDPLNNLAGKPVYVYHGLLDPVVNDVVSADGVAWYQHFGANVEYHDTDLAGHGWPTPDGTVACPLTSPPFMINCGDDPEGEMLAHWFGSVNRPNTGVPEGTLTSFDQDEYAPGGNAPAISMDNTGRARRWSRS